MRKRFTTSIRPASTVKLPRSVRRSVKLAPACSLASTQFRFNPWTLKCGMLSSSGCSASRSASAASSAPTAAAVPSSPPTAGPGFDTVTCVMVPGRSSSAWRSARGMSRFDVRNRSPSLAPGSSVRATASTVSRTDRPSSRAPPPPKLPSPTRCASSGFSRAKASTRATSYVGSSTTTMRRNRAFAACFASTCAVQFPPATASRGTCTRTGPSVPADAFP